jgi:hypothetical protein
MSDSGSYLGTSEFVFLVKFIIAVKYRFLGLIERVARMGKKISYKEEF